MNPPAEATFVSRNLGVSFFSALVELNSDR